MDSANNAKEKKCRFSTTNLLRRDFPITCRLMTQNASAGQRLRWFFPLYVLTRLYGALMQLTVEGIRQRLIGWAARVLSSRAYTASDGEQVSRSPKHRHSGDATLFRRIRPVLLLYRSIITFSFVIKDKNLLLKSSSAPLSMTYNYRCIRIPTT